MFIGKSTRRAVWRYLADREDRDDPESPVFINRGNHPFNSNGLRHLIVRLADKAGVKGAHPHKFRHTFAITYLRSGFAALVKSLVTNKIMENIWLNGRTVM